MTRKTPLERLDDAVRWTGIPQLQDDPPRRHSRRVSSTVALAMAIGGFGAAVARPTHPWAGYAVLMLGFGLAQMMPIVGPLRQGRGREVIDEYDRALRARAFLVALSGVSAVAVLGLWGIAGWSAIDGWTADQLRRTMIDLAFLIGAIYAAGPTCYASWATRPLADD